MKRSVAIFYLFVAVDIVARTLYVSPVGTNDAVNYYPNWAGGATNIQDAVNRANNGDAIFVTNAVYYPASSNIYINKVVFLRSWNNGALDRTNTIINGNGALACLWIVNTGAVVAGFTITNGNGVGGINNDYGGGVEIGNGGGGGGVLSNCLVVGNTANTRGGGIYIDGSTAATSLVVDCEIFSNVQTNMAGEGGGGIFAVRGAVLKNCRIYANAAQTTNTTYRYGGGGVAGRQSYPVRVEDCIISNNASAAVGGGVYFASKNPAVVVRCAVVSNQAIDTGGGIHLDALEDGSIFADCMISGNTAAAGGGMMLYHTYGLISNCWIVDNIATGSIGGGGVRATKSGAISKPCYIKNCFISGNRSIAQPGGSGRGGGGLSLQDSCVVENCTIVSNTASRSGGAVLFYNYGLDIPTLRNCLVAYNTAWTYAGGVYMENTGCVENCTIVGNSAITNCGGLYFYNAYQTVVSNSICYFNTTVVASVYSNIQVSGSYTPAVGYSCFAPTSSVAGDGNIAFNPLFIAPEGGDFRLRADSPCLDAGMNQGWMAEALDLDNRVRLDRLRRQVDMGCYERVKHGVMIMVR